MNNEISEQDVEDWLADNPDLASVNPGIKLSPTQVKGLDLDSTKPKTKSTMPERQFQEWFRKRAIQYGYLFYHTHRSQFSPQGFPDNVLVRLEPEPRLIFCELKTDDLKVSQPSIDQWMWLFCLQHLPAPVECYLFRPSDSSEINEILK